MSHEPHAMGGKLLSKPVVLFAPLILLCAIFIFKRLIFGLGSVSDLNGGYPWGIWIAFDLLIGTGFACGGWALAWAVYVFNRGDYHPLVRPALLERLGWKVALHRLNKVMFFIIALGALLPTMHQSSMGSLMIAAGYKVYPLWQSYEMLPIFSLLTAFIMGFSIVIFEGSLMQASLRGAGPNEKHLFSKLIGTLSVLLALFLLLRIGEISWREKWHYAFAGDFYSLMFWLELALLALPLLILRLPRLRHDSRCLFLGALSMLLGCALWRLSYSLLAFNPGNGYHYFPTGEELLISIGFVAIEVCAYILLIRLLPIIPPLKRPARHEASEA